MDTLRIDQKDEATWHDQQEDKDSNDICIEIRDLTNSRSSSSVAKLLINNPKELWLAFPSQTEISFASNLFKQFINSSQKKQIKKETQNIESEIG